MRPHWVNKYRTNNCSRFDCTPKYKLHCIILIYIYIYIFIYIYISSGNSWVHYTKASLYFFIFYSRLNRHTYSYVCAVQIICFSWFIMKWTNMHVVKWYQNLIQQPKTYIGRSSSKCLVWEVVKWHFYITTGEGWIFRDQTIHCSTLSVMDGTWRI